MRTIEHFMAVFFAALSLAALAAVPFGWPLAPAIVLACFTGALLLLVGLRPPPGI